MKKGFVVIDMQRDFVTDNGIRAYNGDDFVVGGIRDTHYNNIPQTQDSIFPTHCIMSN